MATFAGMTGSRETGIAEALDSDHSTGLARAHSRGEDPAWEAYGFRHDPDVR
jgi:hypothetical protein